MAVLWRGLVHGRRGSDGRGDCSSNRRAAACTYGDGQVRHVPGRRHPQTTRVTRWRDVRAGARVPTNNEICSHLPPPQARTGCALNQIARHPALIKRPVPAWLPVSTTGTGRGERKRGIWSQNGDITSWRWAPPPSQTGPPRLHRISLILLDRRPKPYDTQGVWSVPATHHRPGCRARELCTTGAGLSLPI